MMTLQQRQRAGEENNALHLQNLDTNFYRNVLDSLEDYAVFTVNKFGYINSWNGGAQKLLGYTEDEIIGQYVGILFTEDDLKAGAEKEELKTALKAGRGIDERYHVRKDKTVFWVNGLIFPLYSKSNEHLGFTKIMRNINERKLAEERINDARNYAKSIVESAREPLIVLNKDLSLNTANEAFYKFFRFKKKALTPNPVFELFEKQLDIADLRVLLNRLTNDGSKIITGYEITNEFKAIGKRTLVINGRKIYHNTTRTDLILLSLEDVTEKRSLEQQKDDFISIASHEIRTPITVIKALAQMLEKRSQKFNDVSFSKSLEKIDEKTDKLLSLITYLLDVTQIETGELQVVKSNFDLEQMIAEAIEEMNIINTGHEFVVKGSFKDLVFGDRFRISQVLNNLLNNAIKYSPKGTPVIVKLTKSRNSDQVTISVQDFGMGILKEEQSQLFKRFARSSTVKSKNIAGMGLGLHISREIIKQHNGKIWFKSEPGKGSTFYFQIPVKEQVNKVA